jgi:RNA polymerase sigma-70 factor (ECF subfamily)
MDPNAATANALAGVPDEALAARAGGDFEAFAELYRRYLYPVYRFVRSQTPDDPTAEDVTSHVFMKALSAAESFRGDGKYRSWIFRIAHNAVVTWRERNGRAVAVEEIPESVDPTPSPATQAITQEARGVVWKKVAELPPAQREVVALHYLEDLSTDEIADATKRSKGAIRILLHRARNRLRGDLEGKDLL